jgi:hypothetical protein
MEFLIGFIFSKADYIHTKINICKFNFLSYLTNKKKYKCLSIKKNKTKINVI